MEVDAVKSKRDDEIVDAYFPGGVFKPSPSAVVAYSYFKATTGSSRAARWAG
jgi:hypothetical protein